MINKKRLADTLKTVLISLLVSLNVCIWRDVLEDVFDEAVLFITLCIFGLFLYGKAFHDKGRWRR